MVGIGGLSVAGPAVCPPPCMIGGATIGVDGCVKKATGGGLAHTDPDLDADLPADAGLDPGLDPGLDTGLDPGVHISHELGFHVF